MTQQGILQRAEELAEAIRQHARTLADEESTDLDIVDAINLLRGRALRYADHVLETTGWGDAFADLQADKDVDKALEAASQSDVSDGSAFRLDAGHLIVVKDLYRAGQLLHERQRMVGAHPSDELDHPADILLALYHLDGWDPRRYDQQVIQVLAEEMTCSPAASSAR